MGDGWLRCAATSHIPVSGTWYLILGDSRSWARHVPMTRCKALESSGTWWDLLGPASTQSDVVAHRHS
ncbi:protein of unknown function (plasmid) [Cupriavidus taiwanensis]|uniref:Uncharacterized protein n=1 Tax=Cupriavidus taiwanensis TaxID=164546 RepID=A0A375IS47_9BURK|nr:protein of unknown function [Cupriavidus taiwanensis]